MRGWNHYKEAIVFSNYNLLSGAAQMARSQGSQLLINYFFGTAVNDDFGDVEETGILIAVDEILENKRRRHIDSFIREHRDELELTSGANKIIYKPKS